MIGRVIDISQDKRHLFLERGFLVVNHDGQEQGRVALDDLAAVIASGHGITHSSNLLAALAERAIPFVLCGNNHHPVGMLWAVEGNYRQSGRMDAQINAGLPLKKRLWQQIVRSKLRMQANVLECVGVPSAPLVHLSEKVRSGDPENIEAQGAKTYWSLLFGPDFRRNRDAPGVNTLLNYGYAILRSATAKAVMASGLHPGLGLHHSNALNAMRLVNDLMEPFRPLIDLRVSALEKSQRDTLEPPNKKALADVLYYDLPSTSGVTPVMASIGRLTNSLVQAYDGESKQLDLPCQTLEPLWLQALHQLA